MKPEERQTWKTVEKSTRKQKSLEYAQSAAHIDEL